MPWALACREPKEEVNCFLPLLTQNHPAQSEETLPTIPEVTPSANKQGHSYLRKVFFFFLMKHDKTGQGDHIVLPMHTHCHSYVLFFEKNCLQGCVPACLHHPPCLSAPHPYHTINPGLVNQRACYNRTAGSKGRGLSPITDDSTVSEKALERGAYCSVPQWAKQAEAPTQAAGVTGKGEPSQSLSSQEEKMRPAWLPRLEVWGIYINRNLQPLQLEQFWGFLNTLIEI